MTKLFLVTSLSIVLVLSGCSTRKQFAGNSDSQKEESGSISGQGNQPKDIQTNEATPGEVQTTVEMQDFSEPKENLPEFVGYTFFGIRDILDTTVSDIQLLIKSLPESDLARKEILEFVLSETKKGIANIETLSLANGLSFKNEEDSPRNPEIDVELAQVEGATIAALQAFVIISRNEVLLERLSDNAQIALKRVNACVSEIRKVSVHADQVAYNKRAAIALIAELMQKAVDDLGMLIPNPADRKFVEKTGATISLRVDGLNKKINQTRVIEPIVAEEIFAEATELREQLQEWADWKRSVQILKNLNYSDQMLVEEDDASLLMNRVFALQVRYRTLYHLMVGRF